MMAAAESSEVVVVAFAKRVSSGNPACKIFGIPPRRPAIPLSRAGIFIRHSPAAAARISQSSKQQQQQDLCKFISLLFFIFLPEIPLGAEITAEEKHLAWHFSYDFVWSSFFAEHFYYVVQQLISYRNLGRLSSQKKKNTFDHHPLG